MIKLNLLTKFLALCGVLFLQVVSANRKTLDQNSIQVCSGMYAKEDWNGKVDPFISFNLKELSGDSDDTVSVVIFDFQDYTHLGARVPGSLQHKYICDDYAIDLNMCNSSQKNEFIVTDKIYDPETDTNKTSAAEIFTFHQNYKGFYHGDGSSNEEEAGEAAVQDQIFKYSVQKTGYYCVTTYSSKADLKYKAVVNFRNAFGQLPASEVNNLALYGLLAVFYAVAMSLYCFAFFKHRNELLPLQKYLLAFFVFLTVENILIWGYYDFRNEKGNTAGVQVYMTFLSILTAGKVSFSFFILLIISLGYGVVVPKLTRKIMLRCRLFTIFAWGWCIAFLIQNYLTPSDSQSMKILITFFPAGFCMLVFYFVTLMSLTKTMKYLQEQKQVVKLQMYNKLLKIITLSLICMIAGAFVTSFLLIGKSTIEMIEQNWRYRFFFVDFWTSLVYFCVFVSVTFIWRPTSTSYMLACSQQLPTDPENIADFDLDDMNSISQNNNNNTGTNRSDNPFSDDHQIHTEFNLSDDEADHK
uniref:Membrane protein PTM1 n=1 Tax=Hanseniaspora osmophila TaxID=56408 RepID=A0A1E5RGT7_9ASCO